MSDLKITEIHVRKCRFVIDRATLQRIIRDWAMAKTGFCDDVTSVNFAFHDETAGSPPYKVGTYCTVDLTEDQMMMPKVRAE
jgi:hypothetical protein